SQLLFWKRQGKLLLEDARESLAGDGPPAAYIGASNGDRPEFYSIFTAAVEAAGFSDHRMIGSAFAAADREFLDRAQLILLAGGGLVFHSDGSAEALRHPVQEFTYDGVRVVHSLLMPGA